MGCLRGVSVVFLLIFFPTLATAAQLMPDVAGDYINTGFATNNQKITILDGANEFNSSGTLINDGEIIGVNTEIIITGKLVNNKTIAVSQNHLEIDGDITNTGTLGIGEVYGRIGGKVNNSGRIQAGGFMSTQLHLFGDITNSGSIENFDTGVTESSAKLVNTGDISTVGDFHNTGTLKNYSTISISKSTPAKLKNSGTYTGDGHVKGDFVNTGGTVVANDTMTIDGDFSFDGGIFEVDFEGVNSGDFGFLDVTGAAELLAGTFNFETVHNYNLWDDIGSFQTRSFEFLHADKGITVDWNLFTVDFSQFLQAGFTASVDLNTAQTSLILTVKNTNSYQAAPEPSTAILMGGGISLVGLLAYRKRKKG